MIITVIDVHPIVARGSIFKVFALYMGFTMALVIPRGTFMNVILPSVL